MNKEKRGIIIGMILGDGCLKLKSRDYVEFVMDHCEKQLRYLQWKTSKLYSILGGKPLKIHLQKHIVNGKYYESFRASRQHNYFKQLHRLIYSDNNKKYFTREILNKLVPEGIAYWYMDDGGLVKNYNNANEISSFEIRLYTYCSLIEAQTIQKYFSEVWNILFRIAKHTNKEQYCLRANTKNSNLFLNLVYKFKAPSMEYKFLEPRTQDTLKSEEIVCTI